MNIGLQEGTTYTVIEGVGVEWFESDRRFIGEEAELRILFQNKANMPMAVVEFENGDCLALMQSLLSVSPEQIRDNCIKGLMRDLPLRARDGLREIAEALYDAGYRKFEIVEEDV